MVIANALAEIDSLRFAIAEAAADLVPKLDAMRQDCDALELAVEAVDSAWSKSWAGYHANLYFENLAPPPPGLEFNVDEVGSSRIPRRWHRLAESDVHAAIEARAGLGGRGVKDLKGDLRAIVKRLQSLQQDLVVAGSVLVSDAAFAADSDDVSRIRGYVWGTPATSFFQSWVPKNIVVNLDDAAALSQGLGVPPHLTYKAEVKSARSGVNAAEAFLEAIETTTRKFSLRGKGLLQASVGTPGDAIETVKLIFSRFPQAAQALRRRRAERTPLTMDDEYDVQYLLLAVLALHFDDIRPEEWTPSYAGSATRMDFLLGEHGIVIEVKHTGSRLSDKDIGEQLILDIAHYAAHPRASTLACLVYDPGKRIVNAKGLIRDLESASTDLKVIVEICS
jgi:hypothetical protein